MAEAELEKEEDFLNLPDDELPDYPPGEEPETVTAAPEEAEEEEAESDDNEETDDDDTEESESTEQDDAAAEEEPDDGQPEEDASDESEQAEDTEGDQETQEGVEGGEEAQEQPEGKEKKVEAEKEVKLTPDMQLQQLFAPFKANGRDMQISSVDDAVTLMKMGANYNKKMQGLKPNLRLMKMLENNKLLDEEKLSFLIDLQNQNPQAIAKLLKDSGVDPIDLEEDNTDYTPGTYTVNEKEVDLDMVLEEIKDTPSFQKTIDTISNKWDAGSRKLVQDDPSIILTINEQMDSGLYDQIMGIVQNEKALNRLTEMSDLQAYKHVGDTLQAQGAFAQQPQANEKQPTQKKPQDPKLKNRKKAAANTRSKPAQKQAAFDPLALSDEDFAKLDPALI